MPGVKDSRDDPEASPRTPSCGVAAAAKSLSEAFGVPPRSATTDGGATLAITV